MRSVVNNKRNCSFFKLRGSELMTFVTFRKFFGNEFGGDVAGDHFGMFECTSEEVDVVSLVVHDSSISLLSRAHSQVLPDCPPFFSKIVHLHGKRFQVDLFPQDKSPTFFGEDNSKKTFCSSLDGEFVAYCSLLSQNEKPHQIEIEKKENHGNHNHNHNHHPHHPKEDVRTMKVEFEWGSNKTLFVPKIDGQEVPIQLVGTSSKGYKIIHCGTELEVNVMSHKEDLLSAFLPEKKQSSQLGQVLSPMPGTVRSVSVKPGDKVHEGDELLVLEAMKMQNLIVAPKDGVIKKVNFSKGNEVEVDAVLVEFE